MNKTDKKILEYLERASIILTKSNLTTIKQEFKIEIAKMIQLESHRVESMEALKEVQANNLKLKEVLTEIKP